MHALRNLLVAGVLHQLMRILKATTHTNTVRRVTGQSLSPPHLTLTLTQQVEALIVAHLTPLLLERTVLQ